MVAPILLKDDQRLPDYYTVTVYWLGGGETKFEMAQLDYVENLTDYDGNITISGYNGYRGWTKDNQFIEIGKGSYKYLQYDDNYTKIIQIHNELRAKK